ncbi:MAG: hypothetical protein H7Z12_07990, partial [Rhodospirillaceae bacterium]|nr:hypothetical protein [Rhodospirillales bacterium]
TKATGKKPGGFPPQPPTEGPLPSDQINLTDEETRIMPVAGGGFDQCYNAQAAVAAGKAAGIEPMIATGRELHHPSLDERFAAVPHAPNDPTPVEAIAHRLRTPEGKKLCGLRKQTPEPVFGIIKSVMGFRQCQTGRPESLIPSLDLDPARSRPNPSRFSGATAPGTPLKARVRQAARALFQMNFTWPRVDGRDKPGHDGKGKWRLPSFDPSRRRTL